VFGTALVSTPAWMADLCHDAPAASQVEGAPGRPSNGEVRQEQRGRAHPEHVVRLDGERERVRAVTGQDEALHHVQRDERTDQAFGDLHQPQRGELLDGEGGERSADLGLRKRRVRVKSLMRVWSGRGASNRRR
jgi:hypothetical protein